MLPPMLRFVLLLALAACAVHAPPPAPENHAPTLREALPATIAGHQAVVLEDATGVIAMYAADAHAKASATNRIVTLAVLAPTPEQRTLKLAPGWLEPKDNVSNRTVGPRPAQLIENRYACGPTSLGKPIDPSACSVEIQLAIRLAHDRVLTVSQNPASGPEEVFAIAGGLDVDAIEAAAQHTTVGR